MSVKQRTFTYIGTTDCIRKRIRQHNNGYGAQTTSPVSLRPYSVMAYICGFDGEKKQLRYHIERQWKIKRDYLRLNENNDPRDWARVGQEVIRDVSNCNAFDVEANDLKLVCLFRNA